VNGCHEEDDLEPEFSADATLSSDRSSNNKLIWMFAFGVLIAIAWALFSSQGGRPDSESIHSTQSPSSSDHTRTPDRKSSGDGVVSSPVPLPPAERTAPDAKAPSAQNRPVRPAPAAPSSAATGVPAKQPATNSSPGVKPTDSPPASAPAADWRTVTVHSGDTLSRVFSRNGLPPTAWMDILKLGGDTAALKSLLPGEKIRLQVDDSGRLVALSYAMDDLHVLHVVRKGDGYAANVRTLPVKHRDALVRGTVKASLYHAALGAGLTERLTAALTHIFRWEIKFRQDIRPGDRFSVIYGQLWRKGKRLSNQDILAAEFVNQGHRYRAFRFEDPRGHVGYYTADGHSVAKGILRAPVHYTHISSGFSYHRMDPVLHIVRPHYGVDYAAPIGTPVKAAADGRVVYRARDGGYGRLVVIKSFGRYKTYYAHLHRFDRHVHEGDYVHQGQVIGFVGESGQATGPHLHFGIKVNGVWKNPRTVPLPSASPVPRKYLAQFKKEIAPLLARLNNKTGGGNTVLAGTTSRGAGNSAVE